MDQDFLFDLILNGPVNICSAMTGRVFLRVEPRHNTVTPSEARTRYPLVSSQALYHWATVLPGTRIWQ